jgi:hypothetical protein
MIKSSVEKVGSFELVGSSLLAIDPCYSKNDIELLGFTAKAKPGTYDVFVGYSDEGVWGIRVASLYAMHSEHSFSLNGWKSTGAIVGVDSGQMGIFSLDAFPGRKQDDSEDPFYDECFVASYDSSIEKEAIKYNVDVLWPLEMSLIQSKVSKEEFESKVAECKKVFDERMASEGRHQCRGGIVTVDGVTYGACASSGYGDGGYRVYIKTNSKSELIGMKVKFI